MPVEMIANMAFVMVAVMLSVMPSFILVAIMNGQISKAQMQQQVSGSAKQIA